MVNGQLVTLQDTRENLTAEREPISAIQMSVEMRFYIGDDLCGLVVHGRETGVLTERETVHFGGDDTETVFRQTNERKEDLVRHSKTGNEQQGRGPQRTCSRGVISRGFFVAEELEVHRFYPNTTSRTIMRTKPMAKPMVERLEWVPCEASGMSSSTTT